MHTTQSLLDLAKANSGIPSDYKLGLILGLTTSAISNYRNARSKPDDLVGSRLAELAGLDAGYVLACLHAERAQEGAARSVWASVASRLAQAGSAAALGAVLVVGSPDAMACTPASSSSAAGAGLYLMSNARRTWRRLQAWLSHAFHPLGGMGAPFGGDTGNCPA